MRGNGNSFLYSHFTYWHITTEQDEEGLPLVITPLSRISTRWSSTHPPSLEMWAGGFIHHPSVSRFDTTVDLNPPPPLRLAFRHDGCPPTHQHPSLTRNMSRRVCLLTTTLLSRVSTRRVISTHHHPSLTQNASQRVRPFTTTPLSCVLTQRRVI